MKVGLMSDLHGHLPEFKERVNVVGIAGDIVPLNIQNDTIKSVVWFTRDFVPWAMNLDCDKVLLVGGNHDYFLQKIVKQRCTNNSFCDDEYAEKFSAEIIKENLCLPKKIIYLQDTGYSYNHVNFYGTPWIPDLERWAFYKSHSELVDVFKKIPDNCDVLISHAPGTENDMGTSLWIPGMPMYGCQEITDRVKETGIKLWAAGHVHTGQHKEGLLSNGITRILNVSIKDENYKVNFEPAIVEI